MNDFQNRTSEVLLSKEQAMETVQAAHALGLMKHHALDKNWADIKAVKWIVGCCDPDTSRILDGGFMNGMILVWLDQLGFKNLYGIDIRNPRIQFGWLARGYFKRFLRQFRDFSNWHLSRQSLEQTNFEGELFDAITVMSVMEHGADENKFLSEMSRILKPGGYLIISTDYWSEGIKDSGIPPDNKRYAKFRVYPKLRLQEILEYAAHCGLLPVEPLKYECKGKTISYPIPDRGFTNIFFILKKTVT